jgi:hypothetical protein
MKDNNILHQGWSLDLSPQKTITGKNGETKTYNGILIPFGQFDMHGIYRLVTKTSSGEYTVTEGSNSYYRTISSKGDVKWWSDGILTSWTKQ